MAVFAWTATIWTGRPVIKTAFLFFASMIVLFVIGGVSGVMTASTPVDWQLTQTYFIVAHIHYVLIGINVFPVVGAVYYWFPKMTGRLLDERLGQWNFWTMFVADRLANNIVVIDHGQIIAEGTSAELKAQLGATVIEVAFATNQAAAAAASRLAPIGSVDVDGQELRMNVTNGASAMLETVRALDADHLEPVTMVLREPTLDDVFLSLTGHAAEEAAEDAAGAAAAPRRRGR